MWTFTALGPWSFDGTSMLGQGDCCVIGMAGHFKIRHVIYPSGYIANSHTSRLYSVIEAAVVAVWSWVDPLIN